jgi:hypothetical protein
MGDGDLYISMLNDKATSPDETTVSDQHGCHTHKNGAFSILIVAFARRGFLGSLS